MHKIITRAAVAVTVALALGAGTAEAAPVKRLTPCVFEDGSGGALPCLWDAAKRGNHKGRSYWFDRQGHQHFIR
jgi:hypothetical protein